MDKVLVFIGTSMGRDEARKIIANMQELLGDDFYVFFYMSKEPNMQVFKVKDMETITKEELFIKIKEIYEKQQLA